MVLYEAPSKSVLSMKLRLSLFWGTCRFIVHTLESCRFVGGPDGFAVFRHLEPVSTALLNWSSLILTAAHMYAMKVECGY